MTDYSKYKESAFTHEEMQPMIIETDMTDIVERLQYYTPYGPITDMQADAIMKEAADEIERLREALRGIACTDDTCECGYGEHDGPFCELGRARTALGEDK